MALLLFNQKPYYNTDQVANALDEGDIFNCFLELIPNIGYGIRRRPGLKQFANTGGAKPGDGIFYWEAANKVVAVNDGNVFVISEDKTVTNITTDKLAVGRPVTFADGSRLNGEPFLYMANGKLVFSDNGGNTTYPSDVSTPSTATHVVYLNLRFLANIPRSNRFLFTDTNPATGIIEPDFWNSSDNPLTCESKGDDLVGMYEFLQEILNWGTQSVEVWQDDGATPFSSIPQASSPIGLEAPYSVCQLSNSVFALCVVDGVRAVFKLTGRTPQSISEPISNILASYDDVSDAIGQAISVGGIHLYMLQFPSVGKTWVYDIKGDTWSQWGTWNKEKGKMEQFIGQHSCFVKPWNKHLIMSRVDGRIYEFDRKTFFDGDAPIKSFCRTPWDDKGTFTRKLSERLRIKLKSGDSISGVAYLRYADNGNLEWSPYQELTLSPIGKRDFISDLSRLGIYHSRKYEISITDDADLCFVSADETFKELRF